MAATQCIYAHRHGQGDFPKIKLSIKMGKKLVYFGVMNEEKQRLFSSCTGTTRGRVTNNCLPRWKNASIQQKSLIPIKTTSQVYFHQTDVEN